MTPCTHTLVYEDHAPWYSPGPRWRSCLLCGLSYNRTAFLEQLREAIAGRYRIKATRIVYA